MEQQTFKKFNPQFILLFLAVPAAISLVVSLVLTIVLALSISGDGERNLMAVFFMIFSFLYVLVLFMSFIMLGWGKFSTPFMKRTAKKNLGKNFNADYTYISGTMVLIDGKGGKIALISPLNPLAFQVFPSSAIRDMEINTGELWGSSLGVRLEFKLYDTPVNIDTFRTNGSFKPDDARVLTGVEHANEIMDLLKVSISNCA